MIAYMVRLLPLFCPLHVPLIRTLPYSSLDPLLGRRRTIVHLSATPTGKHRFATSSRSEPPSLRLVFPVALYNRARFRCTTDLVHGFPCTRHLHPGNRPWHLLAGWACRFVAFTKIVLTAVFQLLLRRASRPDPGVNGSLPQYALTHRHPLEACYSAYDNSDAATAQQRPIVMSSTTCCTLYLCGTVLPATGLNLLLCTPPLYPHVSVTAPRFQKQPDRIPSHGPREFACKLILHNTDAPSRSPASALFPWVR
ncbi:hypothetical protein C8Q73DRAFT_488059 [Cubamyces lactineus]|nr:hypothetical protein C8Q73DRAFT_488059 [Cubamyces lactineus]